MILDDLKGARVLVTGASSGIGLAVARAFAEHGAAVAIHYFHNEAPARALVDEMTAAGARAMLVSGDVSRAEEAQAMAGRAIAGLGGLDILVNNAGGLSDMVPLTTYDGGGYDRLMDLNVRSILAVTQAALPALRASGRGSVINTGSVAGRNGGRVGSAIYAAAKAAVHSLTRSMAQEFARDAIRVNAVAPGLILTPFHDGTPPERLEAVKAAVPLNRLGVPQDCVGAYLFLGSTQMSGYTTGAILDVNGGRVMA
ncbi:SDR family oxidoreductase [Ancylobacter sp. MQZ15Z-1]|uniref:SDR family oxidoreductase n=1 Tax=Ancylobacter mangrovi TaxID=2972472 RepID=A0A9X2T4L2_9HYPH|nr:SDR family oxidoreductase [Ancylobacter mangrovi]MCS0494484.1 SDR family oxidoreductase [Ancylobacter mangrovi]